MSQNEFEKILDGIIISSNDATMLFVLTCELSKRHPNLRLKDIVDAKKLFDAQQGRVELPSSASPSRAERRAIERSSKKKGTRRKRR